MLQPLLFGSPLCMVTPLTLSPPHTAGEREWAWEIASLPFPTSHVPLWSPCTPHLCKLWQLMPLCSISTPSLKPPIQAWGRIPVLCPSAVCPSVPPVTSHPPAEGRGQLVPVTPSPSGSPAWAGESQSCRGSEDLSPLRRGALLQLLRCLLEGRSPEGSHGAMGPAGCHSWGCQ